MSGITLNMRKQIESSTLIVVLLILLIGINVIECRNIQTKSYERDQMPKVINNCRAACIERFLFERENVVTQLNCNDHNNCAMCWDFCETLIVAKSNMFHSICTNHTCVSFSFIQFLVIQMFLGESFSDYF